MLTTTTVQGGEFGFSAAHTGLHEGEFEPLHGHSYQVALRLSGEPDEHGMLIDFSKVKAALREAIAPLRRRTLMPANAPQVRITPENNTVSIAAGRKWYMLPAADVALLPLPNTTTEALVAYLLDQVAPTLHGTGLARAELTVFEAADTSATTALDLA